MAGGVRTVGQTNKLGFQGTKAKTKYKGLFQNAFRFPVVQAPVGARMAAGEPIDQIRGGGLPDPIQPTDPINVDYSMQGIQDITQHIDPNNPTGGPAVVEGPGDTLLPDNYGVKPGIHPRDDEPPRNGPVVIGTDPGGGGGTPSDAVSLDNSRGNPNDAGGQGETPGQRILREMREDQALSLIHI